MKNNFCSALIILGVIMLFAACDKNVHYSRIVQNDSDFDVKMIIASIIESKVDTLVIEKKTIKIISSFYELGNVNNYADCNFHRDSISMLVYFDDSPKLITGVNKLDIWSYNIIKKETYNSGGRCECRIVLTNAILNEL